MWSDAKSNDFERNTAGNGFEVLGGVDGDAAQEWL